MSAKKSKFVTVKKEIFEGERRKDTKCTRSKSGHFHEISELDDEKDDDVELCISCASEVESRIEISKKYTKGKKKEKKSLHGFLRRLLGHKRRERKMDLDDGFLVSLVNRQEQLHSSKNYNQLGEQLRKVEKRQSRHEQRRISC
ncbi:uncharacterized protein LOC134176567 [Corticium candelabrum]|uniref:uncharacterized protein LOC134176567 n=1 Tax=Corticium candelabrum TaxID=121492 RepID=UPI002E262B46|nr:uncharacterized protein LOC134176567 [Corticium candelabrum]